MKKPFSYAIQQLSVRLSPQLITISVSVVRPRVCRVCWECLSLGKLAIILPWVYIFFINNCQTVCVEAIHQINH